MGRAVIAVVLAGLTIASAAQADDKALEREAAAQLRQAISDVRTSDPELAQVLEQQLAELEHGQADTSSIYGELTVASTYASDMTEPGFSGPSPEEDLAAELEEDPKMVELREHYEAGELSEEQARETLVQILNDHGIDPGDGEARMMEHFLGAPDSSMSVDDAAAPGDPLDGIDGPEVNEVDTEDEGAEPAVQ